MKKTLLLALAMCCLMPGSLAAKKKKTVEKKDTTIFTVVKANPITSIKDQNQSGTCWAYSSLGFFEAELLRLGKKACMICASHSSFTTPTWTVPTSTFVRMVMPASRRVVRSTMPFTA